MNVSSMGIDASKLTCFCSPPDQCVNKTPKCVSTIGCFYSVQASPITEERFGCISESTTNVNFLCNSPQPSGIILRCCTTPQYLCNKNLTNDALKYGIPWLHFPVLIIFPIIFFIFSLISCILFIKFICCSDNQIDRFRKRKTGSVHYPIQSKFPSTPISPSVIVADSGSGSGTPFLVQQTIARQTTLTTCIGKGRFGEVWRALCQGDEVAVKIFSSRDEASWARETEVYNTGLLRHANLLAYYASDMISRGGCTQMWLITGYHAGGSLHDLLQNQTVPLQIGLKFARSAAAGLVFLHTEVGKPRIAHRDVKSKNILIMDNGETCLADLGLALVKEGSIERVEPPPAGPLSGTKRYMAPELLSLFPLLRETEEEEDDEDLSEIFLCQHTLLPFEMYQAADVYALGLVFWEISRRTQGISEATFKTEDYKLPYYDDVPTNPKFIQMFRVVVMDKNFEHVSPADFSIHSPLLQLTTCESCNFLEERLSNHSTSLSLGRRPPISDRWLRSDSGLPRMVALMRECWHPVWTHRLSALRVRKTLESIEAAVLSSFMVEEKESN